MLHLPCFLDPPSLSTERHAQQTVTTKVTQNTNQNLLVKIITKYRSVLKNMLLSSVIEFEFRTFVVLLCSSSNQSCFDVRMRLSCICFAKFALHEIISCLKINMIMNVNTHTSEDSSLFIFLFCPFFIQRSTHTLYNLLCRNFVLFIQVTFKFQQQLSSSRPMWEQTGTHWGGTLLIFRKRRARLEPTVVRDLVFKNVLK